MQTFLVPDIRSIRWPSLNVEIPVDPNLKIDPITITPVGGEPDDFELPSVPDPEFDTIDPATAPVFNKIIIPTPPDIDISDISLTVPEINVSIPEGSVDWAYEQYTNALITSTEAQCALLDGLHGNLWSNFESNQWNVWNGSHFNLVETLGFTDVLSIYRNKELLYGKSLYESKQSILREISETKNKHLYIDAMLAIQRNKRKQYADQKAIELLWAKDIVGKSIDVYNLAIKEYAANINRYKVQSNIYRTTIENNAIRIKAFETLINSERLKIAIDKNILERYKAEVAVQIALVNLYKAQMDVVKIISDIEAMNVDIYRFGVEAFINQVKQITETAKQDTISAEVQAMRVELRNTEVWIQELYTRYQAALLEKGAAEDRRRYAESDFRDKLKALQAISDITKDSLEVNLEYIDAEADAIAARLRVSETRELSQLQTSEARLSAAQVSQSYEDQIATVRSKAKITDMMLTYILKIYEEDLQTKEIVYKADLAERLNNTHLINIFTEYNNTTPPGGA